MTDVAQEDINACLERICSSAEFAESNRLQGLLGYVVKETLAGRGDDIRAKSIALDFYGYSTDELAKREGVVRVDAGRVRRKLEDYYAGSGSEDPLTISLPVGSYRPRFVESQAETVVSKRRISRAPLILSTVGFVALVAAVVSLFLSDQLAEERPSPLSDADLFEIFDVAPTRVEAANLAEVGRDLIFPAVDLDRLKLAFQVFSTAIKKDNTYYGGFAGSAQVHATLALLASDNVAKSSALEQAREYQQKALSLQPNAGWALSAAAWVQFAGGEARSAAELSRRAVQAAPNDPHVIEFDSLISLYTSDFQRIIELSQQGRDATKNDKTFVFANALGSALFHTKDYRGAITQFEGAINAGAPFGPISITYIAASYQMDGDQYKARKLIRLLEQTWPNVRVVGLKRRLFTQAAPVNQLDDVLKTIDKSK